MFTTIIVVDSFIEDALYNTLNALKSASCVIIKLDLYSVTKDNIHVKFQEHITNKMETQTLNITKVLFVNFDVLVNNIGTEVFLGEISKLYNLELHDPEFKSWNHINECIVTLSKSFEIENVDFLDINHLIHYESYAKPLEHVDQSANGHEAFNVNVNYLSKFCSLEQSEAIKSSTNWLHLLFTTLYSQNNELKQFLDTYFTINNTILGLLETLRVDALDIFSKEFIEYQQNEVLKNDDSGDCHIALIPVHYYDDDVEEMLILMNSLLESNCYIGLIYENDTVDNVNEVIRNTVRVIQTKSNHHQINVNILLYIPKNIGSQEVSLSKEYMPLLFEAGDESVVTLKNILESLSTNPLVKRTNFCLSNVPEQDENAVSKYFQEVMSHFESSEEIKIVLDRPKRNNDILYKPSASYISHQTIFYHNEVIQEVNESYALDFIPKSKFDTFSGVSKVNKLILYDASLSEHLPEVYSSLTPDTEILLYHSHESFDILKEKIASLNELPNVSLTNVSLFKKDTPSFYFSLFDEEQSLKHDVEKDNMFSEERMEFLSGLSDEDLSQRLCMDISLNTREEFIAEMYELKEDHYLYYKGPDPSLNTWEKFSNFLLFLQNDIKVSNFDILTCKIVGEDWEYILNKLQDRLDELTIHSSIDNTGHTMFRGDWILETPENTNLVGLYFNDNIYNVKVKLDSDVFTNNSILRYAIREYAKIGLSIDSSNYFDTPIEDWVIKIRHLNYILYPMVSASTSALDWSRLDGIGQWDISYVTNLDEAFQYFRDIPIGGWDTKNVTSMNKAFNKATLFNQDISGWDTSNVTSMNSIFNEATTFNQDLSWNVSKVRSMSYAFSNCHLFNGDITGWQVQNVTNMNYMFNAAYGFNQDLSNWNVTSNLTTYPTKFTYMFRYARGFNKVLSGDWENIPYDTIIDQYIFGHSHDGNVNRPRGHINIPYDANVGFTSTGQLKCALKLYVTNNIYAESLFGEIGSWNISNLTNLDYLFTNVWFPYSNPPNLNNWDTSNIKSMKGTFQGVTHYNPQSLDKWDVSEVTNMDSMFYGASRFNQDISTWDTKNVANMDNMFYGCMRFNWDISVWDTNNVTSNTNMFSNATHYNELFINTGYVPDTSVTGHVFSNKTELQTALAAWKADRTSAQNSYGHISKWDVTFVGDFSGLFEQSFSGNHPFSEDLNSWDTGNVTNMNRMFYNCRYANPKITNWNTEKVTNLDYCFYLAQEFSQDLSWNVGNVTTMSYTFCYMSYGFNGDITNWNTEKVTNMLAMFQQSELFNRDLSKWDVGNVTNFSGMFHSATAMNQVLTGPSWVNIVDRMAIPTNMLGRPGNNHGYERASIGFKNNVVPNDITLLRQVCKLFSQDKVAALLHYPAMSQWDVSSVTNMDKLFHDTYPTTLDISGWDVSKVTSMTETFTNATSLDVDFSSWDTGNVTNMSKMFYNCKCNSFDSIKNWDVKNVTSFTNMFYSSVNFDTDLNNWDIISALYMDSMFENCYKFNSNISDWDLSGVLATNRMFYNCSLFNVNISGWDVETITNMKEMFYNCKSFRVDLSDWKIDGITSQWGILDFLSGAWSYYIVLDGMWTVLHDQLNDGGKTLSWMIYAIFKNRSPGTISAIPYNSPQLTFTSTDISNNSAYENDEIVMNLVVNTEVSGSVGIDDLQITNGVIKNFNKISELEYTFIFTATTSGSSSHINVNPNSTSLLDYFVEEPFVWIWFPATPGVEFLGAYTIGYDQTSEVEVLKSGTGAVTALVDGSWRKFPIVEVDATDPDFYNNVYEVTWTQNIDNGNQHGGYMVQYDSNTGQGPAWWWFGGNNYWATKYSGGHYEYNTSGDYRLSNTIRFKFTSPTTWECITNSSGNEVTYSYTNSNFDGVVKLFYFVHSSILSRHTLVVKKIGASSVNFNSPTISNNSTYENDEIVINIVVDKSVSGSVGTNDLQITNGTVKNFYQKSELEYTFIFTSSTFGQSSQITVNPNSSSLSDYVLEEPFEWTWSPPITVMTFDSPDISNNQSQTTSSIGLEINLSREFLTIEQLIQKEDVSITNGVITGFQRVNNTKYSFTFIATSPNITSVIEMANHFDASNTTLPNSFSWTWSATIEQPVFTISSVDVNNNDTIKKNEIDMLLTYTPNRKLAIASLTETDISFTNGFIVNNSFSKISPTQYSFRFRSLSRDTNSTLYIPQNQFQYNFVDGATNLTENYEGSSTFNWKYNGLDIDLINNQTVAVITSEQKESKSLDLILHGNVTYDPVYNEYNFEKSTSDYITISGEVLNGSGEASISFWYKTKTTANTSFATLLTLRNDDNDNFTIQRRSTNDQLNIKSSGNGTINTTTTNLTYYNTDYVHIVVTFTATEILVYKNSVLEETHSISNVIAGGERTFQMIGASTTSANAVYRHFNGYIKNLRFYNYAIPLTEVSALYTMYNTGMNDTAPQILNVNLTTTDTLTNNEFPKAVINMEMDVTYDSVASISSIDSQSFVIDKSNFDTSFGYVFDFKQLSESKVSFKFGSSTTIHNSELFLKQDTITRNINSSLNVVSNPESNAFTWKYKSEPLTIQTIKSNIGAIGSFTNQDVIWIQVIFSEEVFNFRKHYITGTNCKVIKTTGSGTRYAIKVQTFRPSAASIVIDIPSSRPITTGKGLNKALADANNATYNWQYDNIVPTYTIETSQESGLTNNADYVDFTVVASKSTSNFDINSLNVNGSAEIVNFSGSGQNYSYRLQPFASSAISLTLPSGAFSDEYGNKNTSSHTFNWTYHKIKPDVYIASQDINSGDSADVGSIETYFVFSKPVSGFTLADVDITNGNLSELTQSTTFPEHENTYKVTIGSKASANNPYASKGSSSAFFLNGEEAKVVSFVAGNTYTFNNASNSAHPLKFYTDAEKTSGSEYTTGVTVSATSTIIVVDSNTPTTLYYQCEAHDYMGNMITYGESYKATLIPASSSVSISFQIADNKVKDSLGIFNDTASNSFVWNYTGTDYMASIESPDLKSGASHLYSSVQITLSLSYPTFDSVVESIFTVVNGTITNIDEENGNYTFTLESVTPNTETSLLLPENSVTRYDNNSEGNKESNKFVWTYTPPIPKLTMTTSDVKEGAFTNNSSIDLQLNFTENVVFDVNTINITNASGTLSGSNNSYVLTVVPDVVEDSSADILVSFPEDTGFYNFFDNENLYNDISYNYSWKYDSVTPTGTISSSVSSIVQDVCSNIQDVPFNIQFNKSMPSLTTNDFTVSSNGALSGLSGSDSLYSFVISALDNTIDNTISFKVGDDAITDEAGNYFSSSNEFSFTITAKVSKVLETAAIAELFTDDADIAEEDKLSSDEINMVLAIEIPDLTVPDFVEVEGGEVSVDLSYTVTVDTKTSSNSYYSQGSSSAYYIDGTEALSLALDQDNVYRFNQDDLTNSEHPLLFYEDVDKSVQYTTDISVNGTPGSAGAYTQISITSDTPSTLYYQCGNHGYMGGIITVGEVDSIPVVALPASVTITNSKVFTRLIDQILEMADDVTAIKMSLDDVAMSETATEKIPDVEQVIMAKSNQLEPPVVIEDTGVDSVLFVPLANEGDLVKVEINGVAYLTVVNSDNTFALNIDGVVATGSPFSKDDVYVIDDTNSIIFGSQIISSSPPPPSLPTVDMTSSVVQNGATTTTGTIDIDLSFSTTVEIDLKYIYTLTSDTQITNLIQSVDASNSIVVVTVSPILPDVSAELGIIINETTFYSTLNSLHYYNDVSFSFSWNYDATAYNNANVVEVVEEYEPVFIDPTTGFIPCFLKDTNILTTKGYKKVQNLIPGKDMLIDHKNNIIECLEVKKYVKQNDGKEYPHRIPCGSQLSKEFICDQDLFLTYNHCIYLPNNDMFAPVSLMKHIKQHVTNDPYFVYYHVFTSNYFSDTIIANGIPCETHSKYAFNYLRGLDSSGKLLKKVIEKTNMLPNCRRNRISRKKYNKLVNKFVKNKNKYRK